MQPPSLTPAQHASLAQQALPAPVWAYVEGGAADELTLRRNLQAWQTLALRPRVLLPLAGGHLRVRLLGREWPHPVLVAPMAAQALLHREGEAAVAAAASALQAGLVLSGQSSTPLAEVARIYRHGLPGGPLWLQMVPNTNRRLVLNLLHEAADLGFEALVMTVDAPVQGVRDRQRAEAFAWNAAWVADPRHTPARPGAGLDTAAQGATPAADAPSARCGGWLEQAATWDDMAWLARHSLLPVLLKGITHPEDAKAARERGCAGVIVSNHGGRVLDTQPATASLLPAVARAVGQDITVLVDGGLRRGTDVLKALALGAHAVLIGRPVLYGLAHSGAAGVAQVLRLLLDEFDMAMALCGCRTVDDIGPHLLEQPHHAAP